jgi:hypothetical protein
MKAGHFFNYKKCVRNPDKELQYFGYLIKAGHSLIFDLYCCQESWPLSGNQRMYQEPKQRECVRNQDQELQVIEIPDES